MDHPCPRIASYRARRSNPRVRSPTPLLRCGAGTPVYRHRTTGGNCTTDGGRTRSQRQFRHPNGPAGGWEVAESWVYAKNHWFFASCLNLNIQPWLQGVSRYILLPRYRTDVFPRLVSEPFSTHEMVSIKCQDNPRARQSRLHLPTIEMT